MEMLAPNKLKHPVIYLLETNTSAHVLLMRAALYALAAERRHWPYRMCRLSGCESDIRQSHNDEASKTFSAASDLDSKRYQATIIVAPQFSANPVFLSNRSCLVEQILHDRRSTSVSEPFLRLPLPGADQPYA